MFRQIFYFISIVDPFLNSERMSTIFNFFSNVEQLLIFRSNFVDFGNLTISFQISTIRRSQKFRPLIDFLSNVEQFSISYQISTNYEFSDKFRQFVDFLTNFDKFSIFFQLSISFRFSDECQPF